MSESSYSNDLLGVIEMLIKRFPPIMPDCYLLRPKEAAELLNVSRPVVYRLIEDGRLGALRCRPNGAGELRIPRKEITAFIEQAMADNANV